MFGEVNMIIQVGPVEFSAQFHFLDIDTSYNLLLGSPFIHMAKVKPCTLPQIMKFIWKDEELLIRGKGSHSGSQISIINEVSRGIDFHRVEMVNTTNDDLAPESPMPSVYKMIPRRCCTMG